MPTIYRVQDIEGRGPWRPGFSHKWVEDRPDHEKLKPFYAEFPAIVEAIRVACGGYHFGSGCRSLEKLRRWFTESEMQTLKRHGYRCVEMEVDEIIAESDIQCVFYRSKPLRKKVKVMELY